MLKNRGKYAERKVAEFFKSLKSKSSLFDFIRLPDARVGRGAGKQVGDFQVFLPNNHIVVEVKELANASILPRKNLSQLPKMRRRGMAGGKTAILVYHTDSKTWRVGDFDWFYSRRSQPSWDLGGLVAHKSIEDAWHYFVTKFILE